MSEKTKKSRLPMAVGLILLAAAGIWGLTRVFGGGSSGIPGETNQQRIEYIESFGWNTGVTHCDLEEIRIPVNFDEIYEEYNDLQKKQGFDLRSYRAHSVKKYTYEISRSDDDPLPLYAELLVENGVIIGADITSAEAGGMMTVLAEPD
ncbi:MAG: DUF4830 domain-containing protein [Oscillospiraceae bacterium]|nr:DUF4830 domain-containing protein [Oscillospiraceae bacterium]